MIFFVWKNKQNNQILCIWKISGSKLADFLLFVIIGQRQLSWIQNCNYFVLLSLH